MPRRRKNAIKISESQPPHDLVSNANIQASYLSAVQGFEFWLLSFLPDPIPRYLRTSIPPLPRKPQCSPYTPNRLTVYMPQWSITILTVNSTDLRARLSHRRSLHRPTITTRAILQYIYRSLCYNTFFMGLNLLFSGPPLRLLPITLMCDAWEVGMVGSCPHM